MALAKPEASANFLQHDAFMGEVIYQLSGGGGGARKPLGKRDGPICR